MTDRRQELGRHYLQPGSPAYKAIKQAIEDQGIRTEEIFDRLEKRMDRLDRDIARADQSQDRLANELVEMRRDVGELRDATHIAANKAAKEAKSAAEVVVSAAKPKLWQKWQAWAVAFEHGDHPDRCQGAIDGLALVVDGAADQCGGDYLYEHCGQREQVRLFDAGQ